MADDLAAGRLVRLCPDMTLVSPLAYYVVYRPERAGLPRLAAFRDWLLAEAAQAGPAPGFEAHILVLDDCLRTPHASKMRYLYICDNVVRAA